MGETKKHSFLSNLLAGAFFVAMGVIPILAAFDMGIAGVDDIHGPPWLAWVAGGVLVLAGVAIWAGDEATRFRSAMGLLIVMGLAVIGNWIAFGAGERACGIGIVEMMPTDELMNNASGWACRLPFGFGALVLDAVFFYVAIRSLYRLLGEPLWLHWLEKGAGWLMVLVLSPFLLVLVSVVGFDVMKTRLRTGKWPRNENFIKRKR